MKKKIMSAIGLCLVALIGVAVWFGNPVGKTSFEAMIIEIQNNSYLVEPVEGSHELNSSDRITVSMENLDSSLDPEVGDIIEITYNGDIMETYPARLGEIYSIKVVAEAQDVTSGDKISVDEMSEEDAEEKVTEEDVTGNEVHLVCPLPTTIDLDNITECTLAISLENGDIYEEKSGDHKEVKMKVKVYDYELFDMVDVAMLEVGSILEINKEQIEVTSIERNDLGNISINGGLDVGGYELHTDENGVYYSIGYSDIKTHYEIGEIVLMVSQEFVYTDASDLDNGEKMYTVEELIASDNSLDYSGTPHNTSIVVEEGMVISMKRVYMP